MTSTMKLAILTVLAATWVLAQPKPPALLKEALRRLPDVVLFDPSRDLRDGHTIQQLMDLGYWPPWVVADLDRDGRPDVVAAVVKRTPQGTKYGVFAIHATTPGRIQWVIEMQDDPLNGVHVGKDGKVTPLFCIQCDANAWFNWTGQSYEVAVFAIREHLSIAEQESVPRPMEIFAMPKQGSRIIGRVKTCTKAKVLAVRGTTTETRWYFVDVLLSRPLRGWIPATSAVLEGYCPTQ